MPTLKEKKWFRVADKVRRQIAEGILIPGEKLPKWDEFEESFGVSRITVHSAMKRLQHEGFVHAVRNRGTFVTERPPNLFHFALAFPWVPGDARWSQFFSTIASEALALEEQSEYRLIPYQEVSGHESSRGFGRLCEDIHNHRLTGVIFVGVMPRVMKMPVFFESGLPCVSVLSGSASPNIPHVRLDYDAFFDRAVQHLLSQGRRNVAVACSPDSLPRYEAAMQRAGLPVRSYWSFPMDITNGDLAERLMHLLFREEKADRPDGLIIADDNIVAGALHGVQAAGVSTETGVSVVAHCNWPLQTPNMLSSVRRLGFDSRCLLRISLECILRQRETQSAPREICVSPLFEDEVGQRQSDTVILDNEAQYQSDFKSHS